MQVAAIGASSPEALEVEYFYMGGYLEPTGIFIQEVFYLYPGLTLSFRTCGSQESIPGRTTQASSGADCLHCGHSLASSCGVHRASWSPSALCCNGGFYLAMALCCRCEHQLHSSVYTCSAAFSSFVTRINKVSSTLGTSETQTGFTWSELIPCPALAFPWLPDIIHRSF